MARIFNRAQVLGGRKQMKKLVIALLAVAILILSIGCQAPNNDDININGAQRKELDEMDK